MKRKSRESVGEDMVAKKQVIEAEEVEEEQEEVPKVKSNKRKSSKKETSVDDTAVPVHTKTPSKSTKPKKLPSTTPRKKPDRSIYASSIDSSSLPVKESSNVNALNAAKVTDAMQAKSLTPPSSEKKAKSMSPKEDRKERVSPPPVQNDGLDVLSLADISLFGASWFCFGFFAVWMVLYVFQPELASTLQSKIFALFDMMTDSYKSFFVVELSYFFLTLLGFHFVLSLIVNIVDEQKS